MAIQLDAEILELPVDQSTVFVVTVHTSTPWISNQARLFGSIKPFACWYDVMYSPYLRFIMPSVTKIFKYADYGLNHSRYQNR